MVTFFGRWTRDWGTRRDVNNLELVFELAFVKHDTKFVFFISLIVKCSKGFIENLVYFKAIKTWNR